MNEQLTCPRCAAAMRTYHRSGVEIDQCTTSTEASYPD